MIMQDVGMVCILIHIDYIDYAVAASCTVAALKIITMDGILSVICIAQLYGSASSTQHIFGRDDLPRPAPGMPRLWMTPLNAAVSFKMHVHFPASETSQLILSS